MGLHVSDTLTNITYMVSFMYQLSFKTVCEMKICSSAVCIYPGHFQGMILILWNSLLDFGLLYFRNSSVIMLTMILGFLHALIVIVSEIHAHKFASTCALSFYQIVFSFIYHKAIYSLFSDGTNGHVICIL